MDASELLERTFQFSVDVVRFLRSVPYRAENEILKQQLVKAATSIGANYEEAQGAFSRNDFKYKIGICNKESRECHYWLRIIKASGIQCDETALKPLLEEADELKRMFYTMNKTVNFRKEPKGT